MLEEGDLKRERILRPRVGGLFKQQALARVSQKE